MASTCRPYNPNRRVRLSGLALFVVCLLCCVPAAAQSDTAAAQSKSPTIAVSVDNNAPRMHSPRRALILSAVIPGAGQVYNHHAWKVPIIYAALGGVGYYTYYNYTNMKSLKDEYLYRVGHNDASSDPQWDSYPTTNVYNMYETYNKTFQLSIIIGVAVYGLNLLDAYVFGHLFDFQIDDDLALHLNTGLIPTAMMPTPFVPSAGLTLRF